MALLQRCGLTLVPKHKRNTLIFTLKRFIPQLFRNASTKSAAEEEACTYEGVVGLEVHAQINTISKLFSSSPVMFGSPTNTNVSYFDAAFPGTLPILNKCCVEAGILTALACNCTVNKISTFDRKHYFYPDLPAGYQITQQFNPLASNGHIKFVVYDGEIKFYSDKSYECTAYLKQLQLEQDSGRSFHVMGEKSLVDLNRAGIGLMELVFEPTLKNGAEAAALVRELISILKLLGTCTCEMEEGTLRVDANISVNKVGDPLGVRTEVKNINSLKYIERAVDYEIERQIQILKNGGLVVNETRAYDYSAKKTIFMRDKEILQDYRFMPEPNLPPIQVADTNDESSLENSENIPNISDFYKKLPVLPEAQRQILIDNYGLPLTVADLIVKSDGFREVFEYVASSVSDYQVIYEFLFNTLQALLNVRKIYFSQSELSLAQLAGIIELLASRTISVATASDVLEMLLNGDQRSPKEIIQKYNWYLISDGAELEKLCLEVISIHAKTAKKYGKSGKKHYMTTLLVELNKKVNNRASIKDAREVFNRLIQERMKNDQIKKDNRTSDS